MKPTARKRTQRCLLLLTLACFAAGHAGAEVVRNPFNDRYLYETETQSHLLLTGFGSIVFAERAHDYADYIRRLRENGVRYARMWTLQLDPDLDPWTLGAGPFETGGIPWDWNEEYWVRFRGALTLADSETASEIVYVGVMLFDRSGETCAQDWQDWVDWPGDDFDCETFRTRGTSWRELQSAWVGKILTETAPFKNVFYEIENEPAERFQDFLPQQEWHQDWAAFVKGWPTPRAVALTPPVRSPERIPELDAWSLENVDVMNFQPNSAQEANFGLLRAIIRALAALGGGKAVSMDEFGNDACEDAACQEGLNHIRRAGWTALGSGAYFHIEDILGGHPDPGIVKDLLENIETFKGHWRFRHFAPVDEIDVGSQVSTNTIPSFCTKGTPGGRPEYVCYLPTVPQESDRIVVTLPPPLPFEGWRLRAWSPRNPDNVYEAPRYYTDSLTEIIVDLPPGSPNPRRRDWVLHIDVDEGFRYDLAVSGAGSGTGHVGSAPAGIDCGGDCAQRYEAGTGVTLTATPAPNSIFTGWSGGGCGVFGQAPCELTMNADRTVTAVFDLREYTLTLTKAGNGTVRFDPPGFDCGAGCGSAGFTYTVGTPVTLRATTAPGSAFLGWGGACQSQGLLPQCDLTMNDNLTVTASFGLPAMSLGDTAVVEGQAGSVNSRFTVSLSPASSLPATVNYATASGTAIAGSDFTAASGTITFPAGTTTQTLNIPVLGDTGIELPRETFLVNLSSPSMATIADGQAQATIVDDEASSYVPMTPCRIVDTRSSSPLACPTSRDFSVLGGTCGVPASARSVAIVVTTTGQTGIGHLRVYPAPGPLPDASMVNFIANKARAGNGIVALGQDGKIGIFCGMSSGSTHVIVDVMGYFQ